MSAYEQAQAGIALTYGVRHLLPLLRTWENWCKNKSENYVQHIARLQKMEARLKTLGLFQHINADTRLDTTIVSIMTAVDRNFDDWISKVCENAVMRTIGQMESLMKHVGLTPPDTTPGEVDMSGKTLTWTWDEVRRDHWYWSPKDKVYKYSSGVWIGKDGSKTTPAEEAARRAARERPKAPPLHTAPELPTATTIALSSPDTEDSSIFSLAQKPVMTQTKPLSQKFFDIFKRKDR